MEVSLGQFGRGLAARFPYSKEAVDSIKLCAGFKWNPKERAWVSEGPEVLLDMERYRIGYTTNSAETKTAVADFYARLQRIVDLKRMNQARTAAGGDVYGFQPIGSETLFLQQRGLLCDDMGLGKTKQALDAANMGKARFILVLAPKTLVYNWEAEVHKWYPEWETRVISTPPKTRAAEYAEIRQMAKERGGNISSAYVSPPIVVIANYEKATLPDWPLELRWHAFIFDEAHKIKNTKTNIHKRVATICGRAAYVFALTGTPLEIRAEETFGIMSAVRPSVFGPYWRFREQHCEIDDWGRVDGLKDSTRDLFRERIGPWMTRRTKDQVATQLPKKIYNVINAELSAEEAVVYKQISKGFDTWAEDKGKMEGDASVLTQLIRFQQFTSSPYLLGAEHLGHGAKYAMLLELLEGWEGRTLIFTRFKQMANLLQEWLGTFPRAFITGDINDAQERLARVNEFNAGKLGRIFIGTDAAAFGLSFQADLVVHYDKLWNPAKEWQREDRAHGIGRGIEGRATNVVHLLTEKTLDIGMHEVTQQRAALFHDIVDGAEATVLAKYTQADYRKMIRGESVA